jgi:hypothetical protein
VTRLEGQLGQARTGRERLGWQVKRFEQGGGDAWTSLTGSKGPEWVGLPEMDPCSHWTFPVQGPRLSLRPLLTRPPGAPQSMRASRAPRASSSCCSHTAARWARDWWANGKPRALDLRGTTANTLHRGGRGPSQPRPLSCLFPLVERTCRTAFTSHRDEVSFPSDPARSSTAGHMAADGHPWATHTHTHTQPLGTETFLRTAHVDAQIPTIKFEWQQSRQGGQGFIEGRRIPCGVPMRVISQFWALHPISRRGSPRSRMSGPIAPPDGPPVAEEARCTLRCSSSH